MTRSIRLLAVTAMILCGVVAAAADDPIDAKLAAAKAEYAKSAEKLKAALLGELKKKAEAAKKAGDLNLLEKVEAEIKAFEEKSAYPKSISTKLYEAEARKAKAKLEDSFGTAIKQYTMDGKIELAKAVRKELEQFKAGGSDSIALFNGKNLSGWKVTGKDDVWAAEGGAIVCKGGAGGYLLSDKEYADFELRFEYRWTKGGGASGVALRTPDAGNPAFVGMEIQLVDDDNWEKLNKGKLTDIQRTGAIYAVQPAKPASNKPIGEWNTMTIVCQGRKLTVELNGKDLLNSNLDDHRTKFDKHPGLMRSKGYIGFQSHTARVEFRNVYIKELK